MAKKVKVKVKKLIDTATLPTYGSDYAAGMDLYAGTYRSYVWIEPGKTEMIRTGIAVEIPTGYVGLIFARSGLSTKQGLAPANKVGVVDSDYRGEVMVGLHNHSQESRMVFHGDRVAQMVIVPVPEVDLEEVDELSETKRGEGGFGSTGK